MTDLQILMPAHNEESNIKEILQNIDGVLKKIKINYSFIVCEDGSTDQTLSILKKLKKKIRINILNKKKKQGYSNAIISGMKRVKAKYLMIMDSDGQCDFNEIIKFWKNRNNADIINGNRNPRKDFLYRRFYSKLALIIYRLFFNIKLKDPSFAFILMKKKVYKSLCNFTPLMRDGFFWEFNVRAKKKSFLFYEINIKHKKRKYGNTKIFHFYQLPIITIRNLIGLLKLRLSI
jgi:glycosyltransferase involved in cell wall biosynthesis